MALGQTKDNRASRKLNPDDIIKEMKNKIRKEADSIVGGRFERKPIVTLKLYAHDEKEARNKIASFWTGGNGKKVILDELNRGVDDRYVGKIEKYNLIVIINSDVKDLYEITSSMEQAVANNLDEGNNKEIAPYFNDSYPPQSQPTGGKKPTPPPGVEQPPTDTGGAGPTMFKPPKEIIDPPPPPQIGEETIFPPKPPAELEVVQSNPYFIGRGYDTNTPMLPKVQKSSMVISDKNFRIGRGPKAFNKITNRGLPTDHPSLKPNNFVFMDEQNGMNEYVTRCHALITNNDGRYYLRDTSTPDKDGSFAGTFIERLGNTIKLQTTQDGTHTAEEELLHDDIIRLGESAKIRFRLLNNNT